MLTKKHFKLSLLWLAQQADEEGWDNEKRLTELSRLAELMRTISQNPRFDRGRFVYEGKKILNLK